LCAGADDLALVSFNLRSVADNVRQCAAIASENSSQWSEESRAEASMIASRYT